MINYDPTQARRLAGRLNLRAGLSIFVSMVLGIVGGMVASPFILQSLPGNISVDLPGWLCGVVFGMLGFGQGMERGFQLRLQAQALLCQIQIEENTRLKTAELVPGPLS